MSELREQIESHIGFLLITAGTWPPYDYLVSTQERHSTDRILALVAEALLSDDAVEAAQGASVTFHDGEGAIRAALAAAGITTTGEEAGT